MECKQSDKIHISPSQGDKHPTSSCWKKSPAKYHITLPTTTRSSIHDAIRSSSEINGANKQVRSILAHPLRVVNIPHILPTNVKGHLPGAVNSACVSLEDDILLPNNTRATPCPQSSGSDSLTITTHNVEGLRLNICYVEELLEKCQLLFLQEH